MASSGLTASQLSNETTQFACLNFGLPVTLPDQTVSRFLFQSKSTDVYTWDKTPISSGKACTVIERSLELEERTKNTVNLFDGIFLILGEDFCQVLPVHVVKHGEKVLEANESILCVLFWRGTKVICFMQNGCFVMEIEPNHQ